MIKPYQRLQKIPSSLVIKYRVKRLNRHVFRRQCYFVGHFSRRRTQNNRPRKQCVYFSCQGNVVLTTVCSNGFIFVAVFHRNISRGREYMQNDFRSASTTIENFRDVFHFIFFSIRHLNYFNRAN